jgi:hypothetical protein
VQVNDATVAPVVRKDDPATGAADAARKAARSGARFRDTLRRAGSGDAVGAGAETAMAAAALTGWFRGEPAPRSPPPPPPIAPAPPPAPPANVDRILIGDIGGDVQARIRIGSGDLAGAEIRLTSAPGSRAVAAELLTRTAGSRQTLSVAMNELRLRLRSKGIALTAPATRPRGQQSRGARGPNDGGGSGSGGGTGR